jgi:hypothetical protein
MVNNIFILSGTLVSSTGDLSGGSRSVGNMACVFNLESLSVNWSLSRSLTPVGVW